MPTRLISTALWFVTTLLFYELAWSITGIPRPLGPILALGVAGFVGVDPLHRIWLARPRAVTIGPEFNLAPPPTIADPDHSDRAA